MSLYARKAILKKAEEAVEDREKSYGSPEILYERQAALAKIVLADKLKAEFPISAADMVLLHILAVKGSRLIAQPDHLDSIVDVAGYASLLKEVV